MAYTDSNWGYDEIYLSNPFLSVDSSWGKETITLINVIDYDNIYWYDGTIRRGRLQYFNGTETIDATGNF